MVEKITDIKIKEKLWFSIIICCFNSEKYLETTLNSIIEQNYNFWELIIIDDGSTDRTKSIINEFRNNYPKIKYFYQKNRGFASARNTAINEASHDWIVILDHDDIALPDRLAIHLDQIVKRPNAKLFFGDTIHFKNNEIKVRKNLDIFNLENINLEKKKVYESLLIEGCFIDSESVVFSKKAAIQVGGFNTKYKYLADYEFFCRMGFVFDFGMTNKILSKWRIHDEQATKKMDAIYKKELLTFYLKNILFSNSIKVKITLIMRIIKSTIKYLIKKNA